MEKATTFGNEITVRGNHPLGRRGVVAGLVGIGWIMLGPGCSSPESGRGNPAAPSAVSAPATSFSGGSASAPFSLADSRPAPSVASRFVMGALPMGGRSNMPAGLGPAPGVSGPADVVFPPRSEPLLFRTALEAKYRDGLRRPSVLTFVDQEGTVVWVQEYLRYRVNLCSHAESVLRVFRQIDGQGIQPTCGNVTTATFPPRQEPLDFMVQLEAKYRDGLRRVAGPSFVDVEGNVIWTQEYMRYRVAACSHSEAQQKVFDQIDGRGVAAACTPPGIVFTFVARACACISGSIEIRINSAIVGNLGCSETRSFSVPAGTYTLSACGNNGCFGGSTLGPFSTSTTRQLVC